MPGRNEPSSQALRAKKVRTPARTSAVETDARWSSQVSVPTSAKARPADAGQPDHKTRNNRQRLEFLLMGLKLVEHCRSCKSRPGSRKEVVMLRIPGHTNPWSLAFAALLLTAFETETGSVKEPLTFKGHTGWIGSIAFAPDGKTLATASADQ